VEDFGIIAFIAPHSQRYKPSLSHYYRIDRTGKSYSGEDNVCGLFEDIQKYYYNMGASIAQNLWSLPFFSWSDYKYRNKRLC